MSATRVRRQRPRLHIPEKHVVEFDSPTCSPGGALSPDLQPNTPPSFPQNDSSDCYKVGRYLLAQPLDQVGEAHIYKAFHCDTEEEYVSKVVPIDKYKDNLSAYFRVGCHDHINEVEEVLLGETQVYVFFARNYGDLHSYVRDKRKLKESEAIRIFGQIVSAVDHCHENGVVLRDLKLRKFVFKDAERTQIKLDGLEDACVLSTDSDWLADKHGCPAYVSPEILNTNDSYSGKAADSWSLGVMLYTMLIGRYPFHDVEPSALFGKIRRGQYSIPDTISSRAKCLIRSLLRMLPSERLTAPQILQHPWFNSGSRFHVSAKAEKKIMDQTVPDVPVDDEESFFV